MTGTNGSNANVTDGSPSGSAQPAGLGSTTDQQSVLARKCSSILEQCQTRALSHLESMVELAIEISQAQLAPADAQIVMQQFTGQLDLIRGSLASAGGNEHSTVESHSNHAEGDEDARPLAGGATVEENSFSRGRRGLECSRVRHDNAEEDEVDDEGSGGVDELTKRELIPWRRPGFQGSIVVNDYPVLREVNDVLSTRNASRGTSLSVYYDLINQPGRPPFPASEWKNIVQGQPVSLDKMFARHQHDSITEKVGERVGSFEFSVSSELPGKRVSSYQDWTIAWEETASAYLYIWPSRFPELMAYRKHICSLFQNYTSRLHRRIIKYDRAVRTLAANTRNFLLHQVEYYPQLDRYWLLSNSIAADEDRDDAKDSKGKKFTAKTERPKSSQP